MKFRNTLFLFCVFISTVSAPLSAKNTQDFESLFPIILLLLTEEIEESGPVPIVPEGADSDFSDFSTWSFSSTNQPEIAFAFDNDLSTRWTTDTPQVPGQFIEINFNTLKTFNNIAFKLHNNAQDFPRQYDVLISNDGEKWEKIASHYAVLENDVEIVLPVQSAQYLRVEQNGRADQFWSIHEFVISLDQQFPLDNSIHVPAVTASEVVEVNRFLNQATFGATQDSVYDLINDAGSYELWIDNQIGVTASDNYLNSMIEMYPQSDYVRNIDSFVDQWFVNVVEAPDQLRQRVAWALSQIFVLSSRSSSLFRRPFGVADYYDLLVRQSFGNYRDLLEAIALHPAMGEYLSIAGNRRENDIGTISPDENFAREIMQLFSIGLFQLNLDGSYVLDDLGNTIETYDTGTVQGFARVFTGWNYQCQQSNLGCTFNSVRVEEEPASEFNQVSQMVMYSAEHETGVKQLLEYPGALVTVIPEGQSGEEDLQMALDNIFYHPNVGPFLSKQLIKKMTSSNPSSGYVERVASVFNDDGTGVRGNLGAVVRAILLDDEAREGVNQSNIKTVSKTKEPIMRIIHLWRNYQAFAGNGRFDISRNFNGGQFSPSHLFSQGPLQASSVFNFYNPFYAPQGEITERNLVAPELQLATEFLNTNITNYFYEQIFDQTNINSIRSDLGVVYLDVTDELRLAANQSADDLIDLIAIKLFGGADQISSKLRGLVKAQLDLNPPINSEDIKERVQQALFLIVSSPEFTLQN